MMIDGDGVIQQKDSIFAVVVASENHTVCDDSYTVGRGHCLSTEH
jgi:hypothetical protein